VKGLWVLLCVLSLGGCAYIDQNLRVEPQLTVLQSNVGNGKKVALRVVDDREKQLIGKRADGYGFAAAKISTEQDLAALLKNSFMEGMHKKGFEPVGDNDSNILLKVTLRSLSYDASRGLWTAGNIGEATVRIMASQVSGKTFEKTYRSQKEIRTAFIGSQETNAKVVNGALNDVLDKIFADEELWRFLAQ